MLCWGYWSLGQPGISSNLQGIVAEPQVCRFVSDRSIKEVACGGNHSVFLLEDGEVYTCGVNTKGQLGHEREGNKPEQIGALADEKDRESPCHVKLLRTQKVVYISCGEEHTAVLTKSGGVFTFGAGSCGQLGHDSVNDEVNPRRVLELMGSEVTQIACGRQHTLALVPSSGLIYAFGCGAKGQLGTGHTCNVKCPSPVKGHWAAHSSQLSARADRFKYRVVKQIFSGGDQTFVPCSPTLPCLCCLTPFPSSFW